MTLLKDLDPEEAAFVTHLKKVNFYIDVRLRGDGLYSAIMPLMFTHAIITGQVGEYNFYTDRWCYGGLEKARAAHDAWDGSGEPEGWHRHPRTGRRRVIDEETSRLLGEYVNP
eukprot:GHVR01070526.1.p1 GENE.GHVR01070526.1~~GHVR01070526.1.p1  ORF type:complete len:113 (-),score=7.57 GHVR01070526.1:128-466(-)